MTDEIVYVRLLDEGVEVLRPVRAVSLGYGVYRIQDQPVRESDTWQFVPGSQVRVEVESIGGEKCLVATEPVRSDG